MAHTFVSEVSLHFWLIYPTVCPPSPDKSKILSFSPKKCLGLLFASPRSHKPSYGPEKENIRDELQRKHLTVRSFQKESFYAELTN